jgi:hypothetical protein
MGVALGYRSHADRAVAPIRPRVRGLPEVRIAMQANLSRLHFIDFARTYAVFLALLAHSLETTGVIDRLGEDSLYIRQFTRTATPIFVFMFGFMIEFVYATRAAASAGPPWPLREAPIALAKLRRKLRPESSDMAGARMRDPEPAPASVQEHGPHCGASPRPGRPVSGRRAGDAVGSADCPNY